MAEEGGTSGGSSDEQKTRAAEQAVKLVQSGMIVGIGSGTTASRWIELLGARVRKEGLKITAVASSPESERLGRSYGIPFVDLEECESIDLTVDGADEIAPQLMLIKGGGGKLLREKIVATASKRFVIIADSSKLVEQLGKFPLPVEVIPMAKAMVSAALTKLGFAVEVRRDADGQAHITEEGNLLLDCHGLVIRDPRSLATQLDSIVGVVEHGLFLGMADRAIVATESGVLELTIDSRWPSST